MQRPASRSGRLTLFPDPAAPVGVRSGLGNRVVIDDEAALESLRNKVSGLDDDNLSQTGQIIGADPLM